MSNTIIKRIGTHNFGTMTIVLRVTDCAECGVVFGVTEDFDERRRDDGRATYCPNGHTLSYRDTKEKRLARELEESKRREGWLRDERNAIAKERNEAKNLLRAQKGVNTKLKKRIANGVCPCCNRHFVNLHQHMKNQHPEFTQEGGSA